MNYYPTQKDIDILSQNEKKISVSMELLNSNFKTIQTLDASLISMSLSIAADSDIRRTGTLNIFPEFDGYELTQESALWIDRYVRIWLKFYHNVSKTEVPYCMGTFLVDTKTFTYDESNDSLSITLMDLMSKLDGTYGGELGEETVVINEGEIIRNAMIAAISLAGINDYVIDDVGVFVANDDKDNKVPYEISIDGGTDVLSVVKELRDLYPAWETFFDQYGTFYCQMIPTCEDDDDILTYDTFNNDIAIYSEGRNYAYSTIKNAIQVYGEEYEDIDYFADIDNSTYDEETNTLNVEIKKYDSYDEYSLLAIKLATKNPEGFKVNINELGAIPVIVNGNPIPKDFMLKEVVYIFTYTTDGKFKYLSEFTPKGMAVLVGHDLTDEEKQKWYEKYNCKNITFVNEPDNPFNVDLIGVKYTKNNDTYNTQTVISDKEALDFAEYELWRKARVRNDITITCDIIPFLDVNEKFSYMHQKSGMINSYITKNITFDISESSAQMTITASTFNPLYPDIISSQRRNMKI